VRHRVLLALLLCQGCAGRGPWAPVTRPNVASCDAPDSPAPQRWQLVDARDFTFCVPPDWRRSGDRAWVTSDDSISWGTGTLPVQEFPGVVTEGPLTGGTVLGVVPICRMQRYSALTAGLHANLGDVQCRGKHQTFAQYTGPLIYFQGAAKTARIAALELAIFRTVRVPVP